jgi:hypothetical protein
MYFNMGMNICRTFVVMGMIPQWKIRWFSISFAIMFLSCNDHLQFHYKSTYFYEMSVIWWVTWVATNSIHHMWNHICMQFMQVNCNCGITTIVQFQCNQFALTIVTSCWHCFSSIHQWRTLLISIAIQLQL